MPASQTSLPGREQRAVPHRTEDVYTCRLKQVRRLVRLGDSAAAWLLIWDARRRSEKSDSETSIEAWRDALRAGRVLMGPSAISWLMTGGRVRSELHTRALFIQLLIEGPTDRGWLLARARRLGLRCGRRMSLDVLRSSLRTELARPDGVLGEESGRCILRRSLEPVPGPPPFVG